jgi:hypothetical protein
LVGFMAPDNSNKLLTHMTTEEFSWRPSDFYSKLFV